MFVTCLYIRIKTINIHVAFLYYFVKFSLLVSASLSDRAAYMSIFQIFFVHHPGATRSVLVTAFYNCFTNLNVDSFCVYHSSLYASVCSQSQLYK